MRLTAIFLSFLLATQSTAQVVAQPTQPSATSIHRFFANAEQTFALKQRSSTRLTKTTGNVAKSVGHGAQTALVILLITYMEAAREQYTLNNIKGQALSLTDHAKIAREAADQLINSFDLASAFAAGTLTGTATSALSELSGLAKVPKSRSILKKLLRSGALSSVTFMGWEAGSQLWLEGINALGNTADVAIGENLRMWDVISGKASPEDVRVYNQIKSNMWRILTFEKPELGELWVYNTWRLRIATGDFVALVASMTAAGIAGGAIIGSAMAPGPGTLVGLAFGLVVGITAGVVGGVVALALPQSWKDGLTFKIQDARIKANANEMASSEFQFRRLAHAYKRNLHNPEWLAFLRGEMDKVLKTRQQIREAILTVHIERYYKFLLAKAEAEFMLLQAQLSKRPDPVTRANFRQPRAYHYIEQFQEEVATNDSYARAVELELLKFYGQEIHELNKFIAKNDLSQELVDILARERDQLLSLEISLQLLVAGMNPNYLATLGEYQLSVDQMEVLPVATQEYINTFQTSGFLESHFL